MSMRLLVTGATGQLGTELMAVCGAAGDEVHGLSSSDLDVADRERVLRVIGAIAPDVVVHAGAWTDVDGCEGDPERALRVNALGTRHVAEAASLVGSRVLYVSSDYVFDGRGAGPDGGRPYTEWDPTGPISSYGRSKLGGEHEVLGLLGTDATVVRASWVCGRYGANFVKTMLRLAADPDRREITVVDDQHGCPTFTADLAPVLRRLALSRLPGVFHVSNEGPVTWCGFAKAIFTAAGHDASRVVPIPTSELRPARPAPRPSFSVLDHVALRGSGLPAMPHWDAALAATVAALT